MKKMVNNFKGRLYLLFLIVLLVPVLCVGSLSYLTAKSAIKNEILYSANESVRVLDDLITKTIQDSEHDITILSDKMAGKDFEKNKTMMNYQLQRYAELNKNVLSVYVGTNDGGYLAAPKVNEDKSYNPREREWYKLAMGNKGEVAITPPYKDIVGGDMVVTVAKTLKDNEGVVAVDIKLSEIHDMATSISIGRKGYPSVLDENRVTLSHPTVELGKVRDESFLDAMYKKDKGEIAYTFDNDSRTMLFTTNEQTGWKITGTIYNEEIEEAAVPILKQTLWVLVIAIIVSAIIFHFVLRLIIKPIISLKQSAQKISAGNLQEEIMIPTEDEIGELGTAFNDMRINLATMLENMERNAEEVAASAAQLTANASETSLATERLTNASQDIATNAESQTAQADKNATSLQELSTAIIHVADISSEVADLAQHTTLQAEEGGEAVHNTKMQMTAIHDSVNKSNEITQALYERSKEISSILDVITSIAEQTNLLALNAAIEAARAGEHGKGFAVVADEVRNLAEQSQQSAQKIFDLIRNVQAETAQSVTIMQEVTEGVTQGLQITDEAIMKFDVIETSMKQITPKMADVTAASEEMAASVQEVTAVTEDFVHTAKDNAERAEDMAASTEEQLASMEEISASAQALAHMADELKTLTSQFEAKI